MAQGDLKHIVCTCRLGINQNVERCTTDQCDDARNVWAPRGRVEQRPGYFGICPLIGGTGANSEDVVLANEDGATGTKTYQVYGGANFALSYLDGQGTTTAAGDILYFGVASISLIRGLYVGVNTANTAKVFYKAEYWNGTSWKYLNTDEYWLDGSLYLNPSSVPFSDTTYGAFIMFAPPGDWTSSALGAYTKYWIRLKFFDGIDTALSGLTLINAAAQKPQIMTSSSPIRAGFFVAQFPSTKRYLSASTSGTTLYLINSDDISYSSCIADSVSNVKSLSEPPTIAIVPQFMEAFIASDGTMTVHKAYPSSTDNIIPSVETSDFAVGPGARFDTSCVAQLGAWPSAKYICTIAGRLWVANLENEPYTVRWSGSIPCHKVWPSLSYAVLIDQDNSPITGMSNYGEQVAVFKNDSVWMMRDAGIGEFDLRWYEPYPVVRGVGCVSNSSVQSIMGSLVFLGEDDIYIFNGTPNIKSATQGRIYEYISRITPGRRPFAVSVNWKTKKCYLLAVSLDGCDHNNYVLVWDYNNDAWWVWDSLDITAIVSDEGGYDNERIIFLDDYGNAHELGVGTDDYGAAITSYVKTSRIGLGSGEPTVVRETRVIGSPNMGSAITVDEIPEDNAANTQTATVDFTDPYDPVYGTAVYGSTTYYANKKQRRGRTQRLRKSGDYHQVKVTNSTKNRELAISSIDVGIAPVGRR